MTVIEKFTDPSVLYARELNNKFCFQQNILMGREGTIYVHIPILSSGDTPKVRLYLFGKTAGTSALRIHHGVGEHRHKMGWEMNTGTTGMFAGADGTSAMAGGPNDKCTIDFKDSAGNTATAEFGVWYTGNYMLAYTAVPKFVQIWIDGTQYTATIGDPNSKGATMYTGGSGWGVDGTTVWDTGELDLSSIISWTVGDHYIELKETGDTGGTLIYTLLVN